MDANVPNILNNLDELLQNSTMGLTPSATQVIGSTTITAPPQISSIRPTDLMSGTDLSNISLSTIALNTTAQSERLLQQLQLLKLKQFHTTNNHLNSTELRRDHSKMSLDQNIAVLDNVSDILHQVRTDCQLYTSSSVLNFITLDE